MAVNTVIHDFRIKLDRSNELSNEPAWAAFYNRLFPNSISIRIDANNVLQKQGIDRIIVLPNGKQITVDEKNNDRDFDHFLCEEWSVGHKDKNDKYVGEKPGWCLDSLKRCDYISYAIIPLQKCYFIPYELLRITCKINIERWKTLTVPSGKAYPRDAHNKGWTTRNCAVTWDELKTCLFRQMNRKFVGDLVLPEPTILNNGQCLLFEYRDNGEAA